MGSQPFIGQLLLVSFSFSPVNWYFCNGQLLPISQNEALYTLIGTTFGGDGVNTFAVPNLQGRVPVHQGAGGYVVGGIGGTESVTLTVSNYPAHNHSFLASSQNSNTNQPAGNAIGGGPAAFSASTSVAGQLTPQTITLATGGSQPHENRQPYLAMNWIISLNGIYPTQS
jgi:microcystin-dependent protein